MQALNLVKEFEKQKMKEYETINEYAKKVLNITSEVKLLDSKCSDSRVVQKLLVTSLEK